MASYHGRNIRECHWDGQRSDRLASDGRWYHKQHDLIGVGMYMKRTFQLFPGTSVGEKILINIFGRYLIDHGSPASFLL